METSTNEEKIREHTNAKASHRRRYKTQSSSYGFYFSSRAPARWCALSSLFFFDVPVRVMPTNDYCFFLLFCILFCCCCSRCARNRFRIGYLCTSLLCICVMSSWRQWWKGWTEGQRTNSNQNFKLHFYYIIRMLLLLLLRHCDDIPSVDGISSILFCLARYRTLILRSIWIFLRAHRRKNRAH